ncbi:MAG: HEAT repeat domain-containing protein [Fimbriimonadia bacterium]|nr:HEAT repeat domain-containing protein [Fimbriimonadia bacterium]
MGWILLLVVASLIIGSAINNNMSTNRLLANATSRQTETQKNALTTLSEREDFFDLLQSRPTDERLRIAEGVEQLNNPVGIKVGLAMLRDPEPRVRERFLQALQKIATPNLDSFIDGLKNGDSNVKNGAVTVMAAVGAPSLPVALKAIEDSAARGAAGDVLTKLGKISVPGLLDILNKTEDEAIKLFVIETLGKIGDTRATAAIQKYLSLPPEKRRIVISALGLIGDPASEADLSRALQNQEEDADARVQAALGLGKIGSPKAAQLLVKSLNDPNLRIVDACVTGLQRAGSASIPALQAVPRDPVIRNRALQALGGIQSATAVSMLKQALTSPDHLITAVKALGENGSPDAISSLVETLKHPNGEAVILASDALSKLGESAIPALTATLKSNNDTAAYYAARALSKMGDPAKNALLNVARDPNARKFALIGLAQMRAPEAKPLFEQAARDTNPDLRTIAERALKGLEP